MHTHAHKLIFLKTCQKDKGKGEEKAKQNVGSGKVDGRVFN